MNKKLMSILLLMSCAPGVAKYNSSNATSPVNAIDKDSTYSLNFATMFLKPCSNLAYSAQATPLNQSYSTPIASPSWNIARIKPHYSFAFDLGASVMLHNKKNILMGDWEHFRSSDAAIHNAFALTDMVGPFFSIGPDEASYKKSQGAVNYQLDKMNINYGQFIEVGQNLTVNLFAGVSFTRLRQNLLQNFSNNNSSITRLVETSNSLSATGPEMGLNLSYHIHKGLNFVMQGTVDLLTGAIKNHTNFISNDLINTLNIVNNEQDITVDNDLQIVPAFSEKIGLNFEHNFRGHCQARFEVGYQAQIFVNALHTIAFASSLDAESLPDGTEPTSGVFARTFQENVTSFAIGGPYFKIDMSF